eukprot:jgi/Chrpa1/14698/Chrysochromulina_OHIO_Genome00023454-RA
MAEQEPSAAPPQQQVTMDKLVELLKADAELRARLAPEVWLALDSRIRLYREGGLPKKDLVTFLNQACGSLKVAGSSGPPPWPPPAGRLFVQDPSSSEPLTEPDGVEVMGLWALTCRFGETLHLSYFGPEALCAALQRAGESVLLTELHVQLLRGLLANASTLRMSQQLPPIGSGLLLQQLPPPEAVSPLSWPEVLRAVLLLLPSREVDPPAAALGALAEAEYSRLSPAHKLSLLRALCDAWLGCPSMEQRLAADAATHFDLSASFSRETIARASKERFENERAAMEAQPDRRIQILNPHHQLALLDASAAAAAGTAAAAAAGTAATAAAATAAATAS